MKKKAYEPRSEKVTLPKTTNYPKDSHKKFCERCYAKHEGECPITGRKQKSHSCNL